jgi:hypothetical protein
VIAALANVKDENFSGKVKKHYEELLPQKQHNNAR